MEQTVYATKATLELETVVLRVFQTVEHALDQILIIA